MSARAVIRARLYAHLAKVDDLALASSRIGLHHRQRRPNAQCAIEDIHTNDDWVTFTEAGDDLQSARPDGLRCRISPLRLDNLVVVRREGVEQVVNDIGYGMASARVNTTPTRLPNL